VKNGLLERKRLAPAREEWESKVKAAETNLGMTAAKFDAELARLAVLQQHHQQQQQQVSQLLGLGRWGGLVTPPSPRSLSVDSNTARQRKKRSSSSRARGKSNSRGWEVVDDRGAESESSMT
jgi:hypothetical protein